MNAKAQQVPLIPRNVLFGNPDKAQPLISPDARQISFLAPADGVLNVWVGPADNPDAAKAVTRDTGRGIREHFWAYTSHHVLYLKDTDGDENWCVYVVDLDTGEIKNLTPYEGVQARVQEVSQKHPDEILIAVNNREPQLHDLHRVNIRTGESELILENPGFIGFETDDFELKLGQTMTPEGGLQLLKPTESGEWDLFADISSDDTLTTGPAGFDKSGKQLYMIDSRDRDTAAVFRVDFETGEKTLLAEDDRADASDVERHPTDKTLQAVAFNYDRRRWIVLDDAVQADFDFLRDVEKGDFAIEARSLDDQHWIVCYEVDNGPRRFYRYDRGDRSLHFLFSNRSKLEDAPLAPMEPVIIDSRDGHKLVSYLTMPVAPAGDPLPMVLVVHGGPWARDEWGYDAMHQWLANRGYAVLGVNFRGSIGFGKAFINAANLEWGRKMHNDLLDAVQWAVANKNIDANRVAIMGGSYGGYATLWAMTNSADVFCCGVDIVGPSNLETLLNSIPPYWAPMIELFAKRVGDHRTDDGKALLAERSPLTHVDRIKRPLLIGQGANDPRVKQTESDQIVAAMQEKKIPVIYVLYPDEGHGFARPENSLSFNAVAEAFLAQYLGGRCEPPGNDFAGSTIQVPAGAENLGELQAHLPKS